MKDKTLKKNFFSIILMPNSQSQPWSVFLTVF